jgi:hypothetical protein
MILEVSDIQIRPFLLQSVTLCEPSTCVRAIFTKRKILWHHYQTQGINLLMLSEYEIERAATIARNHVDIYLVVERTHGLGFLFELGISGGLLFLFIASLKVRLKRGTQLVQRR